MADVNRENPIEDEPNERQTGAGLQAHRAAGQLDLNRATESEIAEIDFIGKRLAHAIVALRASRGGLRSWDDLHSVPGLDAKKIAELQRASRLGELQ